MVRYLLPLLLLSLNPLPVRAADSVSCTFAWKTPDGPGKPGETLTIQALSASQIVVADITNSDLTRYNGTYKRATRQTGKDKGKDLTVPGRDGRNYLGYDAGSGDGDQLILADEALLKSKGKGLIKLRRFGGSGGENDTAYQCAR